MRWRSQAAGTGGYLPERIVTNDELAARLDTSDAWIRQRTGIAERRIAAPGELTSDLATEAARRALERAGMSGGDLDLIVLATATPDQTFPVDRRQGPGAARHEARRRVRRTGGLLRLHLRARRRRQRLAAGSGAHRAGDRRRDLFAHPRLGGSRHLRAVRRRRRRGRAAGGVRRNRDPRHPVDASAFRRPPARHPLCRWRPVLDRHRRLPAHGRARGVPAGGAASDRGRR